MKKIMEFYIRLSKHSSEKRHFEILANDLKFETGEYPVPFCVPVGISMYEYINDGKVKFEPQAYSWTGQKLMVNDAFDDILERLIRNETELLTMIYLDESLKQYVSMFHQKIAAVFEGRKIPYEILIRGTYAKLVFATNLFLYYSDDADNVFMFRTVNGDLVSDNAFAEIGFCESKDAVEEGGTEEKEIPFAIH